MTTSTRRVGLVFAVAMLGAGTGVGLNVRAQSVAPTPAFSCLADGAKVRRTYVRHADPAKQREAARIFEQNLQNVEYPEGTILQLIPSEAMVKRTRAEFPSSNGWEFFALQVSATGTTVTQRGDTAANRLGTCVGCHKGADRFDFVCEKDHGCTPVNLPEEVVTRLQGNDARCAK